MTYKLNASLFDPQIQMQRQIQQLQEQVQTLQEQVRTLLEMQFIQCLEEELDDNKEHHTLKNCFYSENNSMYGCLQEATSGVWMRSKAKPKGRHVCNVCMKWLIKEKLADICDQTDIGS